MILAGIMFTTTLWFIGNNTEMFEAKEKVVKCYDRNFNEIIGLECKEYEFKGQDIVFSGAVMVTLLFIIGSWLYFRKDNSWIIGEKIGG